MAGDTSRCGQARAWASARVDSELSELESRLLDRHLEQCGPCREWERSAGRTAALVRAAPFERPSRPVAVPAAGGGTRLRRALLVAAVAAVAVLASVLGAVFSSGGSQGPTPAPAPELSFLDRPGAPSGGRQQVTPPVERPVPEIPPEEPV